ncbi:MAG: type VI secretion system accessory protein TagJ [Gemmataceae bacterium]
MSATELYKQGLLSDAIQAQVDEVKDAPTDHNLRIFLFELLVFAGDLERARKHLDLVMYEDPDQQLAVVQYKQLIDTELERRKVFAGDATPTFLAEIPTHSELRLKAIAALKQSNTDEAVQLLEQAQQATPVIKATLNGKAVELVQDCDDVLGTNLEVMFKGQYCWVPLEQVATLRMNPPKTPRDLIWFPARLDTQDDSSGEVFLPVLYIDSHVQDDEKIRLGQATEFTESTPIRGYGSRLFLAGDDGISLLEWREIDVEPNEPAEEKSDQ